MFKFPGLKITNSDTSWFPCPIYIRAVNINGDLFGLGSLMGISERGFIRTISNFEPGVGVVTTGPRNSIKTELEE